VTLPAGFVYTEDPETGCWLWDGYCDKNGYARIYNADHRCIEWAHRFSYEAHRGPIPPRHEIDHVCRQTRCVNYEHLDAVTRAEHVRRTLERLGKDKRHLAAAHLRRLNLTYQEIAEALAYSGKEGAHQAVLRAVAKGLASSDEVPRATRLTEIEREEIRDLYTLGVPQTVIGECYAVDSSQVSRICNGHTSGHSRRSAR
jgi:HNH endonuclease